MKDPVMAMIAVLDKKNTPILIKNYLVEARWPNGDEDSSIKLNNQMEMLVYQALDLINDQYNRIKG